MKYKYLGYEENTVPEPRPLTKDDIDAIVNSLPVINASTRRASDVVTAGIRDTLREFLEVVSLVPTQEALDRFIAIMVEHHGLSLVVPGDSIGSNAGSGLSAIITQLTLNTFHRAGFSETVTALKKLENLINAKPVRVDEACIVVFQKRGISFEEALDLAKRYVGSLVQDFVGDYRILPYAEAVKESVWLRPEFLQDFSGMRDRALPNNIFRLYLRPEIMYQHRVTVTMIADTLRKYNDKFKTSLYSVAHGSHLDGVIDIIVNVNGVDNPSGDMNVLECTLFEERVLPHLSSINVKGIPGIKVWTPVRQKVMRLVSTEKKLKKMPNWYQHLEDVGINVPRGDPTYYFLYLDKTVEVRTGVNVVNLQILFSVVNISIVYYFPTKRVLIVKCPVVTPYPGVKKTPESPSQIVAMHVSYHENLYKEEKKAIQRRVSVLSGLEGEKLSRRIAIECDIPRPDIVKKSEYVYVVTQNSTTKLEQSVELFNRLMATEHVDRRYTSSNNMHVMAETHGIEVSGASQNYELYEIITDSDTYVNPSINILIIDTITSRGKPTGATYVGISRHPTNALAAATLERAGSIFTKKSIIGEKKNLRENVSSTICVGLLAPVGTGSVVVAKSITELNNSTHWVIDDEIPTAFMRSKDYVPAKEEVNIQDESARRFQLLTAVEQEGEDIPRSGLLEVSDRNNVDNRRFNLLDRLTEIILTNKAPIVIQDIRPVEALSNSARRSKKATSKMGKLFKKSNGKLQSLTGFLLVVTSFYGSNFPRTQ